jgi:hypothetical protein
VHPFRELYHGANGDNILEIMESGFLRPSKGQVFFSRASPGSVLMHGADTKRMATFSIKVLATIPAEVETVSKATPGVPDTLVVHTTEPIRVQVKELYMRKPRETSFEVITGAENIKRVLSGKPRA